MYHPAKFGPVAFLIKSIQQPNEDNAHAKKKFVKNKK